MAIDSEPDIRGPWREHDLQGRGLVTVQVGPVRLHLEAVAGEIRVAWERSAALEGPWDEHAWVQDPGELGWARWAPGPWTGRIALTPIFPDRPVVVTPADPFHLMGGAEARIYVRLPLWIQLQTVDQDGTAPLVAIPTSEWSDTWWGTPEEGELCYWLQTRARRAVTEVLFLPHMVICPLDLVNRSPGELHVDKIALRVEYLSLYVQDAAIWSDATRVRYQGEAEGSRLEMAGRAPREAPRATLLAPPRVKMARGFSARTFARLRSLQDWMT